MMDRTLQRCPRCGNRDLYETTLGWIGGENPNQASCRCGWDGYARDTVPYPGCTSIDIAAVGPGCVVEAR